MQAGLGDTLHHRPDSNYTWLLARISNHCSKIVKKNLKRHFQVTVFPGIPSFKFVPGSGFPCPRDTGCALFYSARSTGEGGALHIHFFFSSQKEHKMFSTNYHQSFSQELPYNGFIGFRERIHDANLQSTDTWWYFCFEAQLCQTTNPIETNFCDVTTMHCDGYF